MSTPTISRDASGRLAIDVFDIPMEMYPSLCKQIAFEFGFVLDGELITNVADVAFMDFRSDQGVVEMAWDSWSGIIVTAKSAESEPLVRRIGDWLVNRKAETDQ